MITDKDSQSEYELLEEVSELLENVYICMSHSEELTLPLIRSGEFVNRGDFSTYIWKKLIEYKFLSIYFINPFSQLDKKWIISSLPKESNSPKTNRCILVFACH